MNTTKHFFKVKMESVRKGKNERKRGSESDEFIIGTDMTNT